MKQSSQRDQYLNHKRLHKLEKECHKIHLGRVMLVSPMQQEGYGQGRPGKLSQGKYGGLDLGKRD